MPISKGPRFTSTVCNHIRERHTPYVRFQILMLRLRLTATPCICLLMKAARIFYIIIAQLMADTPGPEVAEMFLCMLRNQEFPWMATVLS